MKKGVFVFLLCMIGVVVQPGHGFAVSQARISMIAAAQNSTCTSAFKTACRKLSRMQLWRRTVDRVSVGFMICRTALFPTQAVQPIGSGDSFVSSMHGAETWRDDVRIADSRSPGADEEWQRMVTVVMQQMRLLESGAITVNDLFTEVNNKLSLLSPKARRTDTDSRRVYQTLMAKFVARFVTDMYETGRGDVRQQILDAVVEHIEWRVLGETQAGNGNNELVTIAGVAGVGKNMRIVVAPDIFTTPTTVFDRWDVQPPDAAYRSLSYEMGLLAHEIVHYLDANVFGVPTDAFGIRDDIVMLRAVATQRLVEIAFAGGEPRLKLRKGPRYMYPTNISDAMSPTVEPQVISDKDPWNKVVAQYCERFDDSAFKTWEINLDTYLRGYALVGWTRAVENDMVDRYRVSTAAAWYGHLVLIDYITRDSYGSLSLTPEQAAQEVGLDPARAEIAGRAVARLFHAIYNDTAVQQRTAMLAQEVADQRALRVFQVAKSMVVPYVRSLPIDEYTPYVSADEASFPSVYTWTDRVVTELLPKARAAVCLEKDEIIEMSIIIVSPEGDASAVPSEVSAGAVLPVTESLYASA